MGRPVLASPESRAPLRPVRFALMATAIYALFATLWIVFSSDLAARLADTVLDMRNIEVGKGIAFVATTSLLFFLALLLLGRQLRRRELQILRQDETLMHAERSVLAGIFAASVAHDVNNALTVAMAAAEEVEADPEGELHASLEAIRHLNARLAQMGNERQGTGAPFDLTGALRREVALASRHALVRDCDVCFLGREPVWIQGVRELVARAVLNLIINAAEATAGRGRIEIDVRRDERGALVSVDDDGPGIRPEHRSETFQPFFTTKPTGNGLGLMSVLACAQRHDGRARYRESALGGARFEIHIPAARTLDSRDALKETSTG